MTYDSGNLIYFKYKNNASATHSTSRRGGGDLGIQFCDDQGGA
jgi:hypothetical protein